MAALGGGGRALNEAKALLVQLWQVVGVTVDQEGDDSVNGDVVRQLVFKGLFQSKKPEAISNCQHLQNSLRESKT